MRDDGSRIRNLASGDDEFDQEEHLDDGLDSRNQLNAADRRKVSSRLWWVEALIKIENTTSYMYTNTEKISWRFQSMPSVAY